MAYNNANISEEVTESRHILAKQLITKIKNKFLQASALKIQFTYQIREVRMNSVLLLSNKYETIKEK